MCTSPHAYTQIRQATILMQVINVLVRNKAEFLLLIKTDHCFILMCCQSCSLAGILHSSDHNMLQFVMKECDLKEKLNLRRLRISKKVVVDLNIQYTVIKNQIDIK